MARTTVRVEGLRELGEAMRSLGKEVGTKISRRMTAAAARVVKQAAVAGAPVADEPHFWYRRKRNAVRRRGKVQEKVLVQPGNLKKNIVARSVPPSKLGGLTAAHVVTVRHKGRGVVGEPYAEGIFQEFGTVHHAPQPFLRPAFDNNRMRAVEEMKRVGQRRIEAAAKKAAKR